MEATMTTQEMVAALSKSRKKSKVTFHMMWLRENRFYLAGQKGGAVECIQTDGTYRIPVKEAAALIAADNKVVAKIQAVEGISAAMAKKIYDHFHSAG